MSHSKRKLFGTDGIRGLANEDPVTAEMALRLGRAAVAVLGRNAGPSGFCLIGKDPRESGDFLEMAVAAGVASLGMGVRCLGVVPTPAVSFLVREMGAAFGVVVSASHNHFADNGIKFFTGSGYKLEDAEEDELEKLALEGVEPKPGQSPGRISFVSDGLEKYIEMVLGSVRDKRLLHGVKIALDNANGAASVSSVEILKRLGADLVVSFSDPDGKNINAGCGCTFPEAIGELVKSSGACVGVSHDGDADRILLCDESGEFLDGDEIMAVLALDMLKNGTLMENTLVATIMSNAGLDEAVQAAGGRVLRAGVGDRNVIQYMKTGGYNLGGEQSGHVICRDYNTTGDGIVAAVQVLRIMQESGQPLSELRRGMEKFPSILSSLPVREKPPLESLAKTQKAIQAAESVLGLAGRVLVRYSGTEKKIRILVEGRDQDQCRQLSDEIAEAVKSEIG